MIFDRFDAGWGGIGRMRRSMVLRSLATVLAFRPRRNRADMRGIAQWAEHVAASDPPHAPFAARLQQLAKAYQSKALLQLVEHCLQGDTAS